MEVVRHAGVGPSPWHSYSLQAVNKNIPVAQDCLTALKTQATQGKAMSLATIAVTKARQQLEHAFLRWHSLRAQYNEIQQQLKTVEEEGVVFQNTYAMFFDRLLNIRVDIVAQLENYKRSYKYFSLCDSAVKPDVHKSVAGLYDVSTFHSSSFMSVSTIIHYLRTSPLSQKSETNTWKDAVAFPSPSITQED